MFSAGVVVRSRTVFVTAIIALVAGCIGGEVLARVVKSSDATPASPPACPSGAAWTGSQCVATTVMRLVQCPGGSTWDGNRCVAAVSPDCPPGMHFVEQQGCAPNIVARAEALATSTIEAREDL